MREQLRQAARVLIVASHLDRGHGALALQIGGVAGCDLNRLGRLLFTGSRLYGAGIIEELQSVIGLFAAMEARRTEEHNCVLNLLAAESGQGLKIFGDDANGAPFSAVQERGVFVCQRSGIEWRGSAIAGDDCAARRFNRARRTGSRASISQSGLHRPPIPLLG